MTDKTISPLRRRMIEDMTVRHFTSKTQSDYIRAVTNLARFMRRSPDTASNEDLRLFQLHLTEKHVGAPTINSTFSFFFSSRRRHTRSCLVSWARSVYKRQLRRRRAGGRRRSARPPRGAAHHRVCLLYTSDAADDLLCVDLGGRRIIKKK